MLSLGISICSSLLGVMMRVVPSRNERCLLDFFSRQDQNNVWFLKPFDQQLYTGALKYDELTDSPIRSKISDRFSLMLLSPP